MEELPRLPGTYVLVLRARQSGGVPIGRLGVLDIRPGWYLYIGSAFGPGGLRGRLLHHLRPAARPRWHIDTLRAYAEVREIWFTTSAQRLEHAWAQTLCAQPACTVPLPRFGASDCACRAHLVFCGEAAALPGLMELLPENQRFVVY